MPCLFIILVVQCARSPNDHHFHSIWTGSCMPVHHPHTRVRVFLVIFLETASMRCLFLRPAASTIAFNTCHNNFDGVCVCVCCVWYTNSMGCIIETAFESNKMHGKSTRTRSIVFDWPVIRWEINNNVCMCTVKTQTTKNVTKRKKGLNAYISSVVVLAPDTALIHISHIDGKRTAHTSPKLTENENWCIQYHCDHIRNAMPLMLT